jgi:hypothetical protein
MVGIFAVLGLRELGRWQCVLRAIAVSTTDRIGRPLHLIGAIGDVMSARTKAVLQQTLCRRYVAGVFNGMRVAFGTGELKVCWVLGQQILLEVEVLGAWHHAAARRIPLSTVFDDLHRRGVEFIRFGVGNLGDAAEAFCETFRLSQVVPSVEQELALVVAQVPMRHRGLVKDALRTAAEGPDLASAMTALAGFQRSVLGEKYPAVGRLWAVSLAGFQPIFELHPQHRALIRQADRTAMDVHEGVVRAVRRHGPFADEQAAFDFVCAALARAQQRLDRALVSAEAVPQADGVGLPGVPFRSGADGVAALV